MKNRRAKAPSCSRLPVTVFTQRPFINEVDSVGADGKKVSSLYYAAQRALNWKTGRINSFSGWKKPSACPMKSGFISPPLVISFDTQLISQVNFQLPRLETSAKPRILNAAPRLAL